MLTHRSRLQREISRVPQPTQINPGSAHVLRLSGSRAEFEVVAVAAMCEALW